MRWRRRLEFEYILSWSTDDDGWKFQYWSMSSVGFLLAELDRDYRIPTVGQNGLLWVSWNFGISSNWLIVRLSYKDKGSQKSHPHFNSFRIPSSSIATFMRLAAGFLLASFLYSGFSDGCPVSSTLSNSVDDVDDRVFVTMPTAALRPASGCFPGFNFKMPESPPASLTGWWCDWDTEYAFVGFSYEVSACEY